MTAPKEVIELVNRFDEHIEAYRGGKYNETQLRRDFIDPFFRALGWDVDNTQNFAEQYREVVHEDTIKIGGHTKAPDYSFRIGGVRKFFIEAKNPSVDIKEKQEPAFQLRRYAWSAKLPLSILTDFEEFAIYDCRIRPKKTDKASTARLNYWTYKDYADKWDEITAIFSKDAIQKGSFDQYAASTKGKRGTAEVDDAFLDEIESWREIIAKNIALRNEDITQSALNYAVQLTIDRIIFLRICEDRGIESYGQLHSLCNGTNVYQRLVEIYLKADQRYNSGLFHFKKETGRGAPDVFTTALSIDDKTLKDIFKVLYYPDSPYEFSVISADILGSVYERFLGKVIHLTSGHRAKIEEKPEVKKAGGVYYTPTYIVEYIIKNTVGKLVEDKKPKQVEKLRILDPACGSGSFLIGALQFLFDWHLHWYIEDGAEKHARGKAPKLNQGQAGEWRLTISERKRILTNNIYGVDIDMQAVEVTKLSLLLKVLEGETQPDLFGERALPDLGNNIKCGNSLVGTDIYQQQSSLFEEENDEQRKINPFDWDREFPDIMEAGGFDAVIGNPPYLRIQIMKQWVPEEVDYYKQHYQTADKGNYDVYVVFVERGLKLLNKNGLLGFILPHKFFNSKYGESLRSLIAKSKNLREIAHFGHQQVFEGASTYTCLMFLSKESNNKFTFSKINNLDNWRMNLDAPSSDINSEKVITEEWNFSAGEGAEIMEKLQAIPHVLEDVTDRIFQGLKTSADKIYIVESREQKDNTIKIYSSEKDKEYWLEADLLHPLVKGGDSKAFSLRMTNRLILFPYAPVGKNGKTVLIPQNTLKKEFPLTWTYLLDNKKYLENRERGKMKGEKWYGYVYPKALDVISLPKIFTPDIAPVAAFSFDSTGEIFFTGGAAGGYGILVKSKYSLKYILGLLNSNLLNWYIRQTATPFRGGWYSFEARFIKSLPILVPNKNTKPHSDKLINHVEAMLQLNSSNMNTAAPSEKTKIERQLCATNAQINQIVYVLYGLTDKEIKIIEEST